MARPLRIEFSDAFYHVFSRGNEKKPIFYAHEDFALFLAILKECCERYCVWVHAFCLMPNHFHLLIQTREANLSEFMKRLVGVYTMKFNYRHERVGHLFQGRYKAILVHQENYLLELSRYIHLNPCKENLVEKPENYTYSSMRYYLLGNGPSFLKTDTVLSQYPSSSDYLRFVLSKSEREIDPWVQAIGGIILGSGEFAEKVRQRIRIKKENGAGISRGREIFRVPPEKIKEALQGERSCIQYYFFWKYARLSQDKIAFMFGVTHSAVSQALRRLEKERQRDEVLNSKIVTLERKMSNVKD